MDWEAMLALGAYHGINPGMGWLFAVALGMQQRSVRGVWRALPPIALGHAAAVGVVVAAAALAGVVVPMQVLKAVIATHADHARELSAVAAPASAVRRNAGELPRPDDLVVPHGLRARRRSHAAAVGDDDAGGRVGGRQRARRPCDVDERGAGVDRRCSRSACTRPRIWA